MNFIEMNGSLAIDPRLAATGGAVLGAIAGSFLATLAIRWPQGRSVARGRSCCDGCDRPIAAARLVPIVSYILLRGRCEACGMAIDRSQPAMEMCCAAIGVSAMALRPDATGMAGALFGWWLAALAWIDARHFWLPDRLTLSLLGVGLISGLLIEPALFDRAIGAAAGYLALAGIAWLYRRIRKRQGLGGGDPKLLAAIGAWLGWASLPLVLLGASGLGLGWALAQQARGRPMTLASRLPLGTLMAPAAFACWMATAAGWIG